jgi:hypothetical protein
MLRPDSDSVDPEQSSHRASDRPEIIRIARHDKIAASERPSNYGRIDNIATG